MTVHTEMKPKRCPTCDSPKPNLHPAMQHGGEVQPCRDQWHTPFTSILEARTDDQRLEEKP